MKITKDLLQNRGASENYIRIFSEMWPDGMDVSIDSLTDSMKRGLDILWLSNLIPDDVRHIYEDVKDRSQTVYLLEFKPIHAAYDIESKPLWDELNSKENPKFDLSVFDETPLKALVRATNAKSQLIWESHMGDWLQILVRLLNNINQAKISS